MRFENRPGCGEVVPGLVFLESGFSTVAPCGTFAGLRLARFAERERFVRNWLQVFGCACEPKPGSAISSSRMPAKNAFIKFFLSSNSSELRRLGSQGLFPPKLPLWPIGPSSSRQTLAETIAAFSPNTRRAIPKFSRKKTRQDGAISGFQKKHATVNITPCCPRAGSEAGWVGSRGSAVRNWGGAGLPSAWCGACAYLAVGSRSGDVPHPVARTNLTSGDLCYRRAFQFPEVRQNRKPDSSRAAVRKSAGDFPPSQSHCKGSLSVLWIVSVRDPWTLLSWESFCGKTPEMPQSATYAADMLTYACCNSTHRRFSSLSSSVATIREQSC